MYPTPFAVWIVAPVAPTRLNANDSLGSTAPSANTLTRTPLSCSPGLNVRVIAVGTLMKSIPLPADVPPVAVVPVTVYLTVTGACPAGTGLDSETWNRILLDP